MDLFSGVKKLMRKERAAHVREIAKIDNALEALGTAAGRGGKRTMSAAARKRIGDAQRARWAKVKRKSKAA
jgi:hypothetical protein